MNIRVPPHNFNSHAHVERDDRLAIGFNRLMISTHTLTWSVTGSVQCKMIVLHISTHTLTWSVTSNGYGD